MLFEESSVHAERYASGYQDNVPVLEPVVTVASGRIDQIIGGGYPSTVTEQVTTTTTIGALTFPRTFGLMESVIHDSGAGSRRTPKRCEGKEEACRSCIRIPNKGFK